MSTLALHLIAENKAAYQRGEDTALKLELGCCGLTELPDALFDCTWLEELVISNEWWEDGHVFSTNGLPGNTLRALDPRLSNLIRLRKLSLSGRNDDDYESRWSIADLSALSALTGLEYLDLSNNLLKDIGALSSLSNLKYLDLSCNQVTDIDVLSSLTELEELDLGSNQVTNIEALSSLGSLETLNLGYNQVSDIEPLRALTGLWSLILSRNSLHSIDALSSLTDLRTLFLNSNGLQDIGPLSSLSNLRYLSLSQNRLHMHGVDPLSTLHDLEQLNLNYNWLTDIGSLSELTSLRELHLRTNRLSDIYALSSLNNLQVLDLNYNPLRSQDINVLSSLSNLQQLRLAETDVEDISVLSSLSKLQELNLSNNKLKDISALSSLSGLQELNLSDSKLEDISALSSLSSLQKLNLSNNRPREIDSLSSLTNLRKLYLSSCGLSDAAALSSLADLQELILSNNQLSDIGPLSQLTGLQVLYLRNNQVSDLGVLSSLSNLRNLDLSTNKVACIGVLSSLENLQELNLNDNQLTSVDALSALSNLQKLDLSENKLNDIARLSPLRNLRQLSLSFNWLEDIGALASMSGLQTLQLDNNPVNSITVLSSLGGLQVLNLSGIVLSEIDMLSSLGGLWKLDLSHNQLIDISVLSLLHNLKYLDLNDNQLTDINALSSLCSLEELHLADNNISTFDEAFLKKLSLLTTLELRRNPLTNIPEEVFNDWDCLEHVKSYFRDIRKGGARNNEVKLILVGNGSVGKTQIARRLVDKADFVFTEIHDSTEGISVLQVQTAANDIFPQGLSLNIWDFAGQDIYHATHRIFMQTRAVFLLVWDHENENSAFHVHNGQQYTNEPLRYWLEYTACFGHESPVILVQNKVDTAAQKQTGITQDLADDYRQQYPIKDILQVSALTGLGFSILEKAIEEVYREDGPLRAELLKELPTSWLAVRDRVREQQGKGVQQLEHRIFVDWCREEDIEASAGTLLSFLHDTGVVYYRRGYFRNNIILDQDWAIRGIYRLLDRKNGHYELLNHRRGVLTYDAIRQVWPAETDNEIEVYLDFLLSCELCFDTSDHYQPLKDRRYVLPDMLDAEKPKEVALLHEPVLTHEEEIVFRFLPKVYMQRFIVKANALADKRHIWQKGILLRAGNEAVLVEADYRQDHPGIIIKTNIPACGLLLKVKETIALISDEGRVRAMLMTDQPDAEDENRRYWHLLNREQHNTNNTAHTNRKAMNIFISYAHRDNLKGEVDLFQKELKRHINAYDNDAQFELFKDDQLILGEDWHEKLQKKAAGADIAILLLSADFLQSKYIKEVELTTFLEKNATGHNILCPVYFRPFPFARYALLGKHQFFVRAGSKYGPDYAHLDNLCYCDLVHFDKQSGLIMPDNTSRDRYMIDFVSELYNAINNKS